MQIGDHRLLVPAAELEGAVIANLAGSLDQPLELLDQLGSELEPDTLAATMSRAAELAKAIRKKRASNIRPFVERVTIASDHLTISIDRDATLSALGLTSSRDTGNTALTVDARLTRKGHSLQLIQSDGRSLPRPMKLSSTLFCGHEPGGKRLPRAT